MSSHTFRLFKKLPGFFDGVGAVVSFNTPVHRNFNTDIDGRTADHNALAADWHAVGEDLQSALETYEQHQLTR